MAELLCNSWLHMALAGLIACAPALRVIDLLAERCCCCCSWKVQVELESGTVVGIPLIYFSCAATPFSISRSNPQAQC